MSSESFDKSVNLRRLFGIGIGKMFSSASKSQIENEKKGGSNAQEGGFMYFRMQYWNVMTDRPPQQQHDNQNIPR